MRILVTGSRHLTDEHLPVVRSALIATASGNPEVTIVHGGARGADTLADKVAREFHWGIETWHADWANLGKAAGPVRNQQMVDSGVDACLAFPCGVSKGTRSCVAMAHKKGIPTRVIEMA